MFPGFNSATVAGPGCWRLFDGEFLLSGRNHAYSSCCNYMIEVRHLSGDQYEVRVTDRTATTHEVSLKEADRIRLGGTDISGDTLIAESFRFLLEREANTSILPKFDLPVIGNYFPEYERDIRKRVAQP